MEDGSSGGLFTDTRLTTVISLVQCELYLFIIRLMCVKAKLVPKNNEGDQVRVINFSPYTLTMCGENQDTERASKEVTAVVNIKIKPGCEKAYDEWLRRFLVSVRKVPGYLGTTTIMGTSKDSTVRHIIHRFRDKASLEAWENSQELHELAEEGNKYSTPYLQKATGLETWFTIPDLKAIVPPPKWKMEHIASAR